MSTVQAIQSTMSEWNDYEIEDMDEDDVGGVYSDSARDPFNRVLYAGQPATARDTTSDRCDEDSANESDDSRRSGSSFTHLEPSSPSELYQKIHPTKVRWFYKQEAEKKWTPFIGYDSIRLEICYRLSLSDDTESYESVLEDLSEHDREALHRSDKLVVRGGLYEVDFESRVCSSIFWHGEQSVITRGTWFYDVSGQPIDDPFAATIEDEHIATFQGRNPEEFNQTSPRRTLSEAIHTVSFPDFRVEWYSSSEVYLYSETKSSKIMRSVTERLGFQKSGYKLQRGYYYDACLDDKQPDITHLVFVVHGIGQKMDTEKIIRNCRSLRKCTNWLKDKYFSHLAESHERSEFFPVEWRSSLKLDGDTVESITPHRVRGLRDFLNCSAMDVMYYTSPLYRTQLINGLQDKMNKLYTKFCQRNPHFERKGSKVSIVAHSLGAVISYDIITDWNPNSLYESYVADSVAPIDERSSDGDSELIRTLNATRKQVFDLEQQLQTSRNSGGGGGGAPRNGLKFVVENFFCLGSPLAVFLALRGVRPCGRGTRDYILPTSLVRRLFNIFHPADPVAYRLEPLILKHYSTIMPLHIHYYGTADKVAYERMKVEYLLQESQDKRPHSPPTEDGPDSAGASPAKPTTTRGGGAASESRWSSYWPNFMKRLSTPVTMGAVQPPVMQMKLLQDDTDTESEEPQSDTATASSAEDVSDGGGGGSSLDQATGACCNGVASSPASVGQDLNELVLPPSKSPEVTELDYRLDYVLREGNLENSYISALTSHTAYWNSYDIAYFILTYLHPEEEAVAAEDGGAAVVVCTPTPPGEEDQAAVLFSQCQP